MPGLVEIGSVVLETISKSRQYIFVMRLLFHLFAYTPSSKHVLFQILLKLTETFLKNEIFNLLIFHFVILISSPFGNN